MNSEFDYEIQLKEMLFLEEAKILKQLTLSYVYGSSKDVKMKAHERLKSIFMDVPEIKIEERKIYLTLKHKYPGQNLKERVGIYVCDIPDEYCVNVNLVNKNDRLWRNGLDP